MSDAGSTAITIVCALLALAIVAVLVARKSNTAKVLTDLGNLFSGIVKKAVGG